MANDKGKTPIYLIDVKQPFYEPLWRRVLICAAAALWALMEIWHRQPFWGVIAGAVALYCVYVLFLTYKPPQAAGPLETTEKPDEDDQV